jgi:tetratricopeptide (TPR) repeat protein
MIVFSNIARTMKVVASGLAILVTVTFQASGQPNPLPQTIPTNITDSASGNVELGKGIVAYNSGKLDEALRHFKDAASLNPKDPVAKIWIGEVLTRKVTPGVDSPENLKTAQQAISLYQEVISETLIRGTEPLPWIESEHTVKVEVMKRIALIDISINKPEESKTWQKRVLDLKPKDSEAGFAVGVIDWMQAHQNALTALKAAGIKDDGQGNAKAPVKVMETIKSQNEALVEEGLKYLSQAAESHSKNAEAMTYLDLTYRRKADLDYSNETARLDDVAKANEWAHKAIETRKANEGKNPAGTAAAKL